jgi:hypothetical protein
MRSHRLFRARVWSRGAQQARTDDKNVGDPGHGGALGPTSAAQALDGLRIAELRDQRERLQTHRAHVPALGLPPQEPVGPVALAAIRQRSAAHAPGTTSTGMR